jgi:capsular exopolysaccharide synthesis family protein
MARRALSVIDFFNLEAPFATEFRRLLHKLRIGTPESTTKSLMVTSALLSEGKSTISTFLALTAALHKEFRTLLIDADLRRPSIHRYFAVDRGRGLSDVLISGKPVADCVRKTQVSTLDLLVAGPATSSAAEVFDADRIGRLTEEMKFYYDLIILDTPPILPVSDPMLLAPKIDTVLMVIKAGSTKREVVERAINIMGQMRLAGVVLNNMDNTLPYYYSSDYYGYRYETRPGGKGTSGGRGKSGKRPVKAEPEIVAPEAEGESKARKD